jgi:hypothetical protein
MFECFSWFGQKTTEGISLEIEKRDVYAMKDAGEALHEQVHKDLQQKTSVVDRQIVMVYEKKLRGRFQKLGNLNQKCPYCGNEHRSLQMRETKCTQCKKIFLVQKRVQDLGTAAFMTEQKKQFDLQWKVLSDIKRFKLFLAHEYEYIQKKLLKEGKKNLQESEVMYALLGAYAKNSLSAGHYRLYSAFIFHQAELMRSEQRFAEALSCYFYVHFLHANGVDNSAAFQSNAQMNEELKMRISELLDLGDLQMKKMKGLYDYAILHLNRFDLKRLKSDLNQSYAILTKEFRLSDEEKEGIKPMRSFVLYTKAS